MFFNFFNIFTFRSSHTIPILFYSNKHFFAKRLFLFLITFNMVYFQQPFILDKTSFFLKKTNKTPIFLFYSKWNTILLREKNGMKNYFLYFFGNWKHIFLFWQESNFSNFNEVMKFIDTTTRKRFFENFFLTENHNTRVSALLTTCKRNIRTEVLSRVLN